MPCFKELFSKRFDFALGVLVSRGFDCIFLVDVCLVGGLNSVFEGGFKGV